MAQSASMPLLHEKSRDEAVAEWNGALSRSMGPDFHPFSDTDLSPPPRSVTVSKHLILLILMYLQLIAQWWLSIYIIYIY